MPAADFDILVQSAVAIMGSAGALAGLALWLRKYFKNMGLEDKAGEVVAARLGAEGDILKTLREEVTRLAQMNSMLSGEIAVLQTEIIALRRENVALKDEIEKLNDEIERMARGRRCDECPKLMGATAV